MILGFAAMGLWGGYCNNLAKLNLLNYLLVEDIRYLSTPTTLALDPIFFFCYQEQNVVGSFISPTASIGIIKRRSAKNFAKFRKEKSVI